MSQPISNSGVNEMRATVVVPPYDRERSECWEGDFASQFPVNTQGQPDGMATLCVNTPHEGFRIDESKHKSSMAICKGKLLCIPILIFW